VGIETIRYYEREGLIPRPAKPRSGYRVYPAKTVRRVRILKQCQELGFTLREAAALAEVTDCRAACTAVESKIGELDRRIAFLNTLREELRQMLKKRPSGACCGVLETLNAWQTPDAPLPAGAVDPPPREDGPRRHRGTRADRRAG
jgi:MerR family copper efflux transcriptional regulator